MKDDVNVFEVLSKIKCDTDKKGNFTYVSWAVAWKETKKVFPKANYTIYTTDSGYPAFINKSINQGGFVKVGVTIGDLEHIEFYPILDYSNRAMLNDKITAFDINKSIQRALTKALAKHGLMLNLYCGEDLD